MHARARTHRHTYTHTVYQYHVPRSSQVKFYIFFCLFERKQAGSVFALYQRKLSTQDLEIDVQ